ncbi:hypothetical protein C8J56DRAFT_1170716 [Mycena floridula]|nr:hypothetical protein C8J56DRAFT_1170716 [Mycena floridula]
MFAMLRHEYGIRRPKARVMRSSKTRAPSRPLNIRILTLESLSEHGHDSQPRWKDVAALMHHNNSIRALAIRPTEVSFVSGRLGKWKCPEGAFAFDSPGQNVIIDTLSVNSEAPPGTTAA